jgi:Uri superfamily endonuclease
VGQCNVSTMILNPGIDNVDPTEDRREMAIKEIAPSDPGSYVLILHLAQDTTITVGKLGIFEFPAGWYAYAGSALGPGGLAARLAYHQRHEKSYQWHIDYLLDHAELVEIWWAVENKRKECAWASALRAIPGARVPVPNFGASDCRCLSHLVYLQQRLVFAHFSRALSDLSF